MRKSKKTRGSKSTPKSKRSSGKIKKSRYSSEFEERLHNGPFKSWSYEPYTIRYEQPAIKRTYKPDFVRTMKGITYLVEAKGRFRTMDEAKKYIWIRDSLPENHKLVFILVSKYTRMPGKASKRKDGSRGKRQLMHDWLDKNGFEYFFEEDL